MAAVPSFQSYLDNPETVTKDNMDVVYRELALILNKHGSEETELSYQRLLRKIIELQMQGGGPLVVQGDTPEEVAAKVAAAADAATKRANEAAARQAAALEKKAAEDKVKQDNEKAAAAAAAAARRLARAGKDDSGNLQDEPEAGETYPPD